MRVLFLNQYFPPDPAPTGILLQELADALRTGGHAVDFVAAREDYRGAQQRGGRMRRELAALGRMLFDGLRQQRAEVIFSASSPPCLLVVATLIAAWHRARSVHWVMDVYPDIAVALGEIRAGVVARVIGGVMAWCYRRTDCVVALDDDMAGCLRRSGVEPVVHRPWVFAPVLAQREHCRAAPGCSGAPWTWMYSGNLGRAHEWETLLRAQAELEARGSEICLRFQGGGPSWPAARARAGELGLKHVEWREYVAEAELPASLLAANVLAVTQRPEVRGLLWPSKLGLVMSLPRSILWVGPTDGAIALTLRSLPHAGVFAPGQAGKIAAWLLEQSSNKPGPEKIIDAETHRAETLSAMAKLVTSF